MGKCTCCKEGHAGKKKGPWTKEEDELLISFIGSNKPSKWHSIPDAAGLQRCGKSCWDRWTKYLKPGRKREGFTKEEDEFIISLQALHGNKWAKIARSFPGRTENDIEYRWHGYIKKKLHINTAGGLDSLMQQQFANNIPDHPTTAAVSNAATTTPRPYTMSYYQGLLAAPPNPRSASSSSNGALISEHNFIMYYPPPTQPQPQPQLKDLISQLDR